MQRVNEFYYHRRHFLPATALHQPNILAQSSRNGADINLQIGERHPALNILPFEDELLQIGPVIFGDNSLLKKLMKLRQKYLIAFDLDEIFEFFHLDRILL